jgi:hypothetical protein
MAQNSDPGRGYHDIGGLNYGPIDPSVTEIKPWEKLSTAISNALGAGGRRIFVTDESRRAREQMGEPLYSELGYFERATECMKMILVEKGYLTEAEIESRMEEIAARMAEVGK